MVGKEEGCHSLALGLFSLCDCGLSAILTLGSLSNHDNNGN